MQASNHLYSSNEKVLLSLKNDDWIGVGSDGNFEIIRGWKHKLLFVAMNILTFGRNLSKTKHKFKDFLYDFKVNSLPLESRAKVVHSIILIGKLILPKHDKSYYKKCKEEFNKEIERIYKHNSKDAFSKFTSPSPPDEIYQQSLENKQALLNQGSHPPLTNEDYANLLNIDINHSNIEDIECIKQFNEKAFSQYIKPLISFIIKNCSKDLEKSNYNKEFEQDLIILFKTISQLDSQNESRVFTPIQHITNPLLRELILKTVKIYGFEVCKFAKQHFNSASSGDEKLPLFLNKLQNLTFSEISENQFKDYLNTLMLQKIFHKQSFLGIQRKKELLNLIFTAIDQFLLHFKDASEKFDTTSEVLDSLYKKIQVKRESLEDSLLLLYKNILTDAANLIFSSFDNSEKNLCASILSNLVFSFIRSLKTSNLFDIFLTRLKSFNEKDMAIYKIHNDKKIEHDPKLSASLRKLVTTFIKMSSISWFSTIINSFINDQFLDKLIDKSLKTFTSIKSIKQLNAFLFKIGNEPAFNLESIFNVDEIKNKNDMTAYINSAEFTDKLEELIRPILGHLPIPKIEYAVQMLMTKMARKLYPYLNDYNFLSLLEYSIASELEKLVGSWKSI